MNKTVLFGRIARDPEINFTKNGKQYTKIVVGIIRPNFKKGEESQVDWIPVTFWGKGAEFVGKNFKKGNRILVEGRIQVNCFEKDGEMRYYTEVVANDFRSIEKNSEQEIRKQEPRI